MQCVICIVFGLYDVRVIWVMVRLFKVFVSLVHLISHYIDEGLENNLAVRKALQRLDGAFALGILLAGRGDVLIAARQDSPLAIGYGKDEMYLGSDVTWKCPQVCSQVCMGIA